jgi:hypothetical protein
MHQLMHSDVAKRLDHGLIASSCIKRWFFAPSPHQLQPQWVGSGCSRPHDRRSGPPAAQCRTDAVGDWPAALTGFPIDVEMKRVSRSRLSVAAYWTIHRPVGLESRWNCKVRRERPQREAPQQQDRTIIKRCDTVRWGSPIRSCAPVNPGFLAFTPPLQAGGTRDQHRATARPRPGDPLQRHETGTANPAGAPGLCRDAVRRRPGSQNLPTASRLTAPRTVSPNCRPRVATIWDSTDAPRPPGLSTGRQIIPRTLLTRFMDSADATPGYPRDSTDESNS